MGPHPPPSGLPTIAPPQRYVHLEGSGCGMGVVLLCMCTTVVLRSDLDAHTLPPTHTHPSTSKLERLAAELILTSATAAAKKNSSPPLLSAEEFYRQQQILRRL